MIHNVLVLGGTGFVGRAVCEQLVERGGGAGGKVVVPTRRIMRGRAIQMLPGVLPVEADIHDEATLGRLVGGADAVINLVAQLHGDEAGFERAHVELPRRLVGACRASGVRRVVHVSALGAQTDAPSRYLRSKARGEAVLRESGLDVTILRPSVIFGAGDRLLNLFARLQAVFPVMPLGGADSRYQPVWVDDVARAIVLALERPQTAGETIECVGPRTMTLREIVELAGRLAGTPRRVIALPDGLARLQALALELLPGEPLMSRDNLDSMKVPSVASGRLPGLEQLGIRAADIASVAPGYLGGGAGPARLDAWRSRRPT